MTVQEEMEATEPEIEARDLIEAGLIGGPLAKQRREPAPVIFYPVRSVTPAWSTILSNMFVSIK